jgi:branched-chain amino acid transport system permease protein
VAFWLAYDLFIFDEPQLFLVLLASSIVAGVASEQMSFTGAVSGMFRRAKREALVVIVLELIAFPIAQANNQYAVIILAFVGVFAVAALGLNVVVGSAGLLDLGYVAFFGIGAYIAAIFGGHLSTVHNFHIPFFWVFLMSCGGAGLAGVILGAPTLRLRGDYLAIVTLGFGEIVRRIMENLNLTKGPVGVADIPQVAIGSLNFGERHMLLGRSLPSSANYYYLELVYMLAIIFVVSRLGRSRIGRAWVAIREDEVAASAMGVNTIAIKLLAFGVGAFFAGGSGAIFAHLTTNATPDSFTFIESVTLLAMVVLGGMGNVGGVILGATLLRVMPEKLRFFADYRLFIFGAALVLMMRFRPEGLVPSTRRRREFKEGGGTSLGAPPGGPVDQSVLGH